MQVVKARLQRWVKATGILGELQIGFRQGRRIEDILFVITQSIELALQAGDPLYVAFLDIAKAYDCVDREILWKILAEMGLADEDRVLLQAIYSDVVAEVEWDGLKTAQVEMP
ncbi:uncharacterized protein LOC119432849 [Dermacentor silvarum]|uniref:uncharacterized protein LOC119432849 n=1 Tax=Dermacentor silvarum TaxID=543639 RepID=UPI0018975AF6|nr:uncharacterized protein LOC119432849 [Dermacentor silvarum]